MRLESLVLRAAPSYLSGRRHSGAWAPNLGKFLECLFECHLVFGVLDVFRNILVISVGVGTSDWAFSVDASKTCFALLNFK